MHFIHLQYEQPQSEAELDSLIWPHTLFSIYFFFLCFPISVSCLYFRHPISPSFLFTLDFFFYFPFNGRITLFPIYYELFDDMDTPPPQNSLNKTVGDIVVRGFVSLVHWVVVKNWLFVCSVKLCMYGVATARICGTSLIFSMPLVKM